MSFPRKRESTAQDDGNAPPTGWIPACAGMTALGSARVFQMTPLPDVGNVGATLQFALQSGFSAKVCLPQAFQKYDRPERTRTVVLYRVNYHSQVVPNCIVYPFGYILGELKKSKRGAATPKADLDLIQERLKAAEQVARELER